MERTFCDELRLLCMTRAITDMRGALLQSCFAIILLHTQPNRCTPPQRFCETFKQDLRLQWLVEYEWKCAAGAARSTVARHSTL